MVIAQNEGGHWVVVRVMATTAATGLRLEGIERTSFSKMAVEDEGVVCVAKCARERRENELKMFSHGFLFIVS